MASTPLKQRGGEEDASERPARGEGGGLQGGGISGTDIDCEVLQTTLAMSFVIPTMSHERSVASRMQDACTAVLLKRCVSVSLFGDLCRVCHSMFKHVQACNLQTNPTVFKRRGAETQEPLVFCTTCTSKSSNGRGRLPQHGGAQARLAHFQTGGCLSYSAVACPAPKHNHRA
jgi:hypothetical protein